MHAITESRSFTVWTRPFDEGESINKFPSPRELAGNAGRFARKACSSVKGLASQITFLDTKKIRQPTTSSSRTVHQIMQEREESGTVGAVRNEEEPTVVGAMVRWVAVPLVLLLAFIAYFQLSQQVSDLNLAVADLRGDLTSARGEIAVLTEQNGVLQQEKAGLLDEKSALLAEVAGLEDSLAAERGTVSRLGAELSQTKETLATTINRFETRVRGLEGVVESQKATITVRDQLIGELESGIESREAEIAAQVDTIAARDATIASKDGVIGDLRSRIAQESKVNETLRDDASGLRTELERAFQKIEIIGQEVAAAAKSAEAIALHGDAAEAEVQMAKGDSDVPENGKPGKGLTQASKQEASPPTPAPPAENGKANGGQAQSAAETPKSAGISPRNQKRTGLDLISFRKFKSVAGR